MIICLTLLLKLTSFHHVMSYHRQLLDRMDLTKKNYVKEMTTHFSFDEFKLVEDTTNITISSFNPLRFSHYMRFIFAPTLCFQFDYPTTESIRISYVVKRTIELVLCNLLLVQLAEENCFPTLIEAMKQF